MRVLALVLLMPSAASAFALLLACFGAWPPGAIGELFRTAAIGGGLCGFPALPAAVAAIAVDRRLRREYAVWLAVPILAALAYQVWFVWLMLQAFAVVGRAGPW